ncbi:MAG: hypothetical protein ACHQK8_00590 [Bacteroidia bacterium]
MGLSIHYTGSIRSGESLSALIEEVKDIAEINEWEHFVFENKFPMGSLGKKEFNQSIYGISFTPPGCETIDLCFLSNGRMSSAINLRYNGNISDNKEASNLYSLHAKTQYAGIEIHKQVIHLLKYLSLKYLKGFKLTDEGNYWETLDEKKLEDKFREYDFLIQSFKSSLKNDPIRSGENMESYFKRLFKQIRLKNRK